MSMLVGRMEGLLDKEVTLTLVGGSYKKGILKQDKKGYLLIDTFSVFEYPNSNTYNIHYFELDKVVAITVKVVKEKEDE